MYIVKHDQSLTGGKQHKTLLVPTHYLIGGIWQGMLKISLCMWLTFYVQV